MTDPERAHRDGEVLADESTAPADGRAARLQRAGQPPRDHEADAPQADPAKGPPARHGLARSVLALLILAVGTLAVYSAWQLTPVSDRPELVEFEVMPGWGARRVAQELEEQGLVRNARVFSAYLRVRGLDRSVGEGLYDLDRSFGAAEVAAELVRGGRPRVARVVVPEGLRAVELATRLELAGVGESAEFHDLISEPGELAPAYLPEGASLEGYLFPASYEIPYSESPPRVLGRLLARFEREAESLRDEVAALGLEVHDWVILASIVQSEAGNDEEMPLIAGVFLNRLERGMPLQSDPTVAYGLGKRMPELDPLAGDMQKDHPWNTYTRSGLPAGPISNPGRAALRSVLEPLRADEQGRDYLYFLHGTDQGETVFRPNIGLEDHNRDVDRYLRGVGR